MAQLQPATREDVMHRTAPVSTHRLLTLLSLCALTSVGACKKKEEPKPEPAAEKPAEPTAAEKPSDPATPVAAKPSAKGAIERGNGLGHFIFPNATQFITDVREHAAPPSMAMFVSEQVLRNYLAGTMGDRAKLAEQVRLDQPFGCAVIEAPEPEVPIACVLGYTGGVDAFLTDLGAQGRQQDAGSHAGYYKLDDKDVYIDALGEMVALSNHADLFAKAKPYLNDAMLARASSLDADLEAVVFPAAVSKRYEKEVTEFVAQMNAASKPPEAGSGELAKSMDAYSKAANQQTLEHLQTTEQMQIGLALGSDGLIAKWLSVPVAGSATETLNKSLAAADVSNDLVEKLPAASWAVLRANSNTFEGSGAMRKAMMEVGVSAIVDLTKRKREEVEAQLDQLMTDFQTIYDARSVAALMHLPKTDGGVVVAMKLKEEQSGREAWKTWSEGFTPTSVLGEDAAKKLQWSFKADAAKYEDVAIDRWTIEPTAEGAKELKAQAKDWDKRTRGYKLIIDRIEYEGFAVFVATFGDTTPYSNAVIDALKGKTTIAEAPGYSSLKDRLDGAGSFLAIDVQRASEWLRQIAPPADAGKIPASLGVDLTDLVGVNRYQDTGTADGEVRFSQPFIDRLRALADQ